LWLLGPDSLEEFDLISAREPAKQSMAFPNGGYYVMRDGWEDDSNYLFFDCGPHGMLNCGHAHADALSFDLAANGSTVLVDPGTFTYTGSPELRDWFRSSMAHNTLTIDGESSSVSAGPFSWSSIANCRTSKWLTHKRFDYVQGSHDGYQRLPDEVEHSRGIIFIKGDYWIIRDQVKSRADHAADLWFHFSDEAEPVIEAPNRDSTAVVSRDDRGELSIFVFAEDGCWRREDATVSDCYGSKSPARVYAYSVKVKGNGEILSFLLARSSAVSTPISVKQVEAIGGKAFEISHVNGFDVVMIRHVGVGGRVEMERLSSDSEWIWARFSSRKARVPIEFIVLGGTKLELEGRKILQAEQELEYLVARQIGEQFRVETSDTHFDCVLPIDRTQVIKTAL